MSCMYVPSVRVYANILPKYTGCYQHARVHIAAYGYDRIQMDVERRCHTAQSLSLESRSSVLRIHISYIAKYYLYPYIYIHIFIFVYLHTLIVHMYLMEFHGLSQICPLKCRVSLVSCALSMGQCCSGAGNAVESRDTAPWSVWSLSLFLSILVPFEMKGV